MTVPSSIKVNILDISQNITLNLTSGTSYDLADPIALNAIEPSALVTKLENDLQLPSSINLNKYLPSSISLAKLTYDSSGTDPTILEFTLDFSSMFSPYPDIITLNSSSMTISTAKKIVKNVS